MHAVTDLFPTDEPHTPETLIAASRAIAELWRYLGHATISGVHKILTDPADVYSIVGALESAEHSSIQVLERLGLWARNIGDESTYTDRFGHNDPDGTADQIQSAGHYINRHLQAAARHHNIAGDQLSAAHGILSHLYRAADDDPSVASE
ncbi:hypothetical protein [Nocardia testacea]|uniref:hypothetical protein n=1 Tax=Nocardia testacea TaxID=248551 RepID=UPI0033CA5319